MISIYRKIEDEAMNQAGIYFEQAFLEDVDPIPEGWTTDLESVQPPEELSELDQLKQENEELKGRLEMTEGAILDLATEIMTR